MDLETIEILSVSGEGAGGSASGGGNHWSRTLARPRYALNKDEVKEQQNTHRFTCFDVAERVESDHDILFAGRSNGAVVFWRIVPRNLFGGANKNDRPEETLTTSLPHKGAVMCLAHTPRGTYGALGGPLVFSGATDHTIKIWTVWGGAPSKESCVQTLAEHKGGITGLAFAGGNTLISTARDGSVRLWRPQRGRKLLRFQFFCCVKSLSLYSRRASFCAVWPTVACVEGGEEWSMYCGDSDGTVSVFRRNSASASERLAHTGERSDGIVTRQLPDSEVTLQRRWSHLHSLAVSCLGLVPEHNFLLSLGNDGACRVLDYLQGSTFMTLKSDDHSPFTSVAWDLAHEQLVLANASGVVQVWNTYTESLLLRKKVAKAIPATGPRRGPGSPALFGFHSSKAEGVLYAMSPAEACFFRWKMVKVEGYAVLGRHDDTVVGMGFEGAKSSHRRATAAAAIDPTFQAGAAAAATYGLHAAAKLGQDKAITPPPESNSNGSAHTERGAHSCSASHLGGDAGQATSLSSGGGLGQNGSRGRQEGEEEGEEEEVFGLVVLSACVDGTIRAWETRGMSEKYRMRHPIHEEVTSMLVLPGGSVMATGIDNGNVRFWRLDTGASEAFKAHDNTVSALASCWDSRGSLLFASGGFGGTIAVWTAHAKDGVSDNRVPKVDIIVRHAHGAANGSNCEILCLAFVPAETPLLASAGNDLVVRCWRIRDGSCVFLAGLEGHTDAIEAMIADGVYLLSGGCDGTVRVWNVSCFAFEEDTDTTQDHRDSRQIGGGRSRAVSAGLFKAHPGGVASMSVVTNSPSVLPSASPAPSHELERASPRDIGSAGGLVVTCGKVEKNVKIWDYTFVGEGGVCGRLMAEIPSHQESPFSCVACSQAATGEAQIFAGTADGCILQLAW